MSTSSKWDRQSKIHVGGTWNVVLFSLTGWALELLTMTIWQVSRREPGFAWYGQSLWLVTLLRGGRLSTVPPAIFTSFTKSSLDGCGGVKSLEKKNSRPSNSFGTYKMTKMLMKIALLYFCGDWKIPINMQKWVYTFRMRWSHAKGILTTTSTKECTSTAYLPYLYGVHIHVC